MSTALTPAGDAIEGVVMMTRAEAEQAERAIITGIDNLREQIATFDDQQGWAALGWESFRAWASSRIPDANLRYLYRLRDANQVDKLLGAAIGHTPESHAREVKGVAPDRVPDVFQRADQIAREEGRDRQARDVAAAKQQVLGGMPAAPKLKPGQETPIVPEVLIIGERKSYYEPPPLIREAVQYATPNTLRTPGGTRQKHQAYCLPDDAAFERIADAVNAFGAALTRLADGLRAIGRYADHLEKAGGVKDAPNPLCETIAKIFDPDRDDTGWYLSEWLVPRLERITIVRHTPKMLSQYPADAPSGWCFAQTDCFVLPDDATWDLLQERRQAVQTAADHVDRVLQELGLYSIAQADKRYSGRPAVAPSTPVPTPAYEPNPWEAPAALAARDRLAELGYTLDYRDGAWRANGAVIGAWPNVQDFLALVEPKGTREATSHEATNEDDAIDPELHEENWSIDEDGASPAARALIQRILTFLPPPYQRALAAAVSIEWIDARTLLDQEPEQLIAEATEQLALSVNVLQVERPTSWLVDLINAPTPAMPFAGALLDHTPPATEATPAIVAPGSLFALNDAALREIEESVTLWSEPERLEFAEIRAYAATMVMIIRRGAADDHDRDIVQRLRRRMEDLAEIDDIDDDAWEQLNRDLIEIAAIMAQLETMTQPEVTDGR